MVDQSGGGVKPSTLEPLNTVAGDPARDSTVVSGGAPKKVGRYALLERIGVGGMAEVYLAHQDGAVGFQKKVVVKRILPHLAADQQFVDMFAREAKVAARLSHANVVQIFELGKDGDELFIAMEYLDGLTLHRLASSSWERGWAVPTDVVIRTIADAATGLHAAHTLTDETGRPLRLVHRDVSPDNLMVSKDGTTKVLDFGIAKGDVGGPKTKTGHLRGKIPFMPPEQITGEEVDPRADLYALGVSMYWMLTGERPFDRQSDWHTMHAILNDVPKPPSLLNPTVPKGLDALILQLLEKDREKRPATGREVADRLEELASPGSIGGKKTTVQFLSQVLPSTNQRGNPVSDVLPIPAPAVVAAASSPSPPHHPNVTVPAHDAVSRLASKDSSEGSPVEPLRPAPAPVSSVAPVSQPTMVAPPEPPPPPHAAESQAPAPPRVVSEDDLAIRPVTTPAGANAFADLLSPKPRSGPPVVLIAAGLIIMVVVVVAAVVVIGRQVGGTTTSVDAGTPPPPPGKPPPPPVTSPPPPPVTSPPPPPVTSPATISVNAVNAPTRVRWRVGTTVLGLGTTTLVVPAGTTSVIAEDLRWRSTATVPIVAGIADYDSAPSGIVQLVRTTDTIVVRLGDDDVSRQRKLKLPVGRYVFVVEQKGKRKEVPVEVTAGKTFTVDVAR